MPLDSKRRRHNRWGRAAEPLALVGCVQQPWIERLRGLASTNLEWLVMVAGPLATLLAVDRFGAFLGGRSGERRASAGGTADAVCSVTG